MPNANPVSSHLLVNHYVKIASCRRPKEQGAAPTRPFAFQAQQLAYLSLDHIRMASNLYTCCDIKRPMNTPNFKVLDLESYRKIVKVKIPRQVQHYLNSSQESSLCSAVSIATSVLASPVISIINAAMIYPFSKMTTLQMTSDNTGSCLYGTFLKGGIYKHIYQEYVPVYRLYQEGTPLLKQMANHQLNVRETAKKLVKLNGVRTLISMFPQRIIGGIMTCSYENLLRYYADVPN